MTSGWFERLTAWTLGWLLIIFTPYWYLGLICLGHYALLMSEKLKELSNESTKDQR